MKNSSHNSQMGTATPPLVPRPVEPRHWSGTRLAVERLNRIQHIHVASSRNHCNKIHLYLTKSTSRLPTRQNYSATTTHDHKPEHKTHSCCHTQPDITVDRSFDELEAMQASIREMLNHYHPVYCDLCSHLKLLLMTTRLRATVVFSGGHRARHTRAFLEDVLGIIRRDRRSGVYACPSYKQLPAILQDFLFPSREYH